MPLEAKEDPMSHILFATEGSPDATEAIEAFMKAIGPGERRLTVLTVVPLSKHPEGHPVPEHAMPAAAPRHA